MNIEITPEHQAAIDRLAELKADAARMRKRDKEIRLAVHDAGITGMFRTAESNPHDPHRELLEIEYEWSDLQEIIREAAAHEARLWSLAVGVAESKLIAEEVVMALNRHDAFEGLLQIAKDEELARAVEGEDLREIVRERLSGGNTK